MLLVWGGGMGGVDGWGGGGEIHKLPKFCFQRVVIKNICIGCATDHPCVVQNVQRSLALLQSKEQLRAPSASRCQGA